MSFPNPSSLPTNLNCVPIPTTFSILKSMVGFWAIFLKSTILLEFSVSSYPITLIPSSVRLKSFLTPLNSCEISSNIAFSS